MRFSIIVPVYNRKKYLTKCLDSILNQTFSDYEVIVVDDGSVDGSEVICDKYSEQDSRVKVIHKKNGGLVSARKAGCEKAKGEYIINVDGDDYVDKNLLEQINTQVVSIKPDMLLYGYRTTKNVDKVHLNKEKAGVYLESQLERIRKSFMYNPEESGINSGNILFSIWTKAVKREIYVEAQKKVNDLVVHGEDLLLSFILLNMVNSVQITNISGYYYRVDNNDSLMRKKTEHDFEKLDILKKELYAFCKKHCEYINQINVYIFYRLIELLSVRAGNVREYRGAIRTVKSYGFDKCCKEIELKNTNLKSKILLFFVQKQVWWMFYLYVRRKGRK